MVRSSCTTQATAAFEVPTGSPISRLAHQANTEAGAALIGKELRQAIAACPCTSHSGAARHLADQTISTVRMRMSRALAFLADPALEAAVHPGSGESLDIPEFLAESGTLYMIAETRG